MSGGATAPTTWRGELNRMSSMFRDKFKGQADFDRAQLLARGFAMSEVFCDMNGDVPGGEVWPAIIKALESIRWCPVEGQPFESGASDAYECIEAMAGEDWCISEAFEYSSPGELIDELECRESHCLWLISEYESGRKEL